MKHPRVCIIGAGPAGLYTAKHLSALGSKIQIFESENKILSHPRCTFYKPISPLQFEKITNNSNINVELSVKILPKDLQKLEDKFDAFVLAIGSKYPKSIPNLPLLSSPDTIQSPSVVKETLNQDKRKESSLFDQFIRYFRNCKQNGPNSCSKNESFISQRETSNSNTTESDNHNASRKHEIFPHSILSTGLKPKNSYLDKKDGLEIITSYNPKYNLNRSDFNNENFNEEILTEKKLGPHSDNFNSNEKHYGLEIYSDKKSALNTDRFDFDEKTHHVQLSAEQKSGLNTDVSDSKEINYNSEFEAQEVTNSNENSFGMNKKCFSKSIPTFQKLQSFSSGLENLGKDHSDLVHEDRRQLNGEDIILSAYDIIKGYNNCMKKTDISKANILIIGSGNVAIDCIKHIHKDGVKNIDILSRSALCEAAFTNSSLRDLFDLQGVKIRKMENTHDLFRYLNDKTTHTLKELNSFHFIRKTQHIFDLFGQILYRKIFKPCENLFINSNLPLLKYFLKNHTSCSKSLPSLHKNQKTELARHKTHQKLKYYSIGPSKKLFHGTLILFKNIFKENIAPAVSRPVLNLFDCTKLFCNRSEALNTDYRSKFKEEKRRKIFEKKTEGSLKINFMFNTRLKKLAKNTNILEATMETGDFEYIKKYDKCILAVGFEKNRSVDDYVSTKPVYIVGWARNPVGSLIDIEQDAFYLAQRIVSEYRKKCDQ